METPQQLARRMYWEMQMFARGKSLDTEAFFEYLITELDKRYYSKIDLTNDSKA